MWTQSVKKRDEQHSTIISTTSASLTTGRIQIFRPRLCFSWRGLHFYCRRSGMFDLSREEKNEEGYDLHLGTCRSTLHTRDKQAEEMIEYGTCIRWSYGNHSETIEETKMWRDVVFIESHAWRWRAASFLRNPACFRRLEAKRGCLSAPARAGLRAET